MKKLTKEEMMKIRGGTTLSGTMLNQFNNFIEILLNVGRSLGSSIRRIGSDNICPIE